MPPLPQHPNTTSCAILTPRVWEVQINTYQRTPFSTAIFKDFVDVWIRLDTPLPLDASRRPEVQIVADVGPHEKDICDLIEVWT